MTEAEWLTSWNYRRMYGLVRKQTTTRLARLFAVASCRLKAAEFFDDRIRPAVDAAESWADDLQAEASAGAVWFALFTTGWPETTHRAPTGEIAEIIKGVWRLLDEYWRGVRYVDARHAIAHAVYLCLRSKPEVILTGGAGNAAEYCAWAIDCAEALQVGGSPDEFEQAELGEETPIRRAIANLLRDLYGNPFRPVRIEPLSRTPTVLAIAQAAYADRLFGDLPILADALEDAGCADAQILEHLREPGRHVRGCWVVDLLLGKS